jgi:WD40 repeat protein
VKAVAVAPDGSWLATASTDGTVRIWDTATWRPSALMRVDRWIFTCAWMSNERLAVDGSAGLYVFDFLPR